MAAFSDVAAKGASADGFQKGERTREGRER